MNRLILHAGMSKTGTSSIQNYLYYKLDDCRFFYISLGEVNGSRALATMALHNPENYWLHRRQGMTAEQAGKIQSCYTKRLSKALRRCRRRNQVAIISAEDCWHLSRTDLMRLKSLIEAERYDIEVIIYLRRYVSWFESSFQQNLKWSVPRANPLAMQDPGSRLWRINYAECLSKFAEVFGESNLSVKSFASSQSASSCVVHDFASCVGIRHGPQNLPRENSGLTLDAARLLYSYWKFGGVRLSLYETGALTYYLQGLAGSKFHFCQSLFAPVRDQITLQSDEIFQRYGIDIAELSYPGASVINSDCIASERDMYEFSSWSLAWLAQKTGTTRLGGEGEELARHVAVAVDRLRKRAAMIYFRPWLSRKARRRLGQSPYAC